MIEERINDRDKNEKDRYRTCCSICHIKCGTVFLGAIEAVVAIVVLVTVIQQIMWKNEHSSMCSKNFLRDCLIFQFNHFNVTLIFDYIVVLMMFCILMSILMLMCGILSDTSCLILPHLAVQGLFLLFSLGYFILHAWSYFYGDLYTHSRPFMMQSLIERMWLAALLLVLAAFQTYLFSAVVRCSMYVSGIEESRRRRESAFERCSERVRLAKENGLWRTTSWGGGFQQYKGQYDDSKPKKQAKTKGFRVQWNFNQNVVVEDEQAPLRPEQVSKPTESSPPRQVIPLTNQPPLKAIEDVRDVRPPKPLGRRRSSQMSNASEEVHLIQKEGKITVQHLPDLKQRVYSESPKKDRAPRQIVVQKVTNGDATRSHRDSPNRFPDHKSTTHHTHHTSKSEPRKSDAGRPSTSGSQKKTDRPDVDRKEALHSTQSMSHTSRGPSTAVRPPLRTYKSVDSDDSKVEVPSSPKRDIIVHGQRRRSSLGVDDLPVVTHHVRPHRSPEKKHIHEPVVKKVSITSTSHPSF